MHMYAYMHYIYQHYTVAYLLPNRSCWTYIYIFAYIYSIFHTRSQTYSRGRPRKKVPTRVGTCARTWAVPPRTTGRAASMNGRARPP